MKQGYEGHSREIENERNIVLWGLFFEKILEHIDAFIIVADSSGGVVFANRRFLDFFCFIKNDIVNKNWIETIIPRSSREDVEKIFTFMKSSKELKQFDAPVSINEHGEKYFSWTGIPLKEDEGFLYMFIGRKGKSSEKPVVKAHPSSPKKLNDVYREMIEVLYEASKACEPETAKHAYRVMLFAERLAKRLKFSKDDIEKIKSAALLHDLGKLLVDEKVLFKNGNLNKHEFEHIKKHLNWGYEVMHLMYFMKDIIPIMAGHHENYDGRGYPVGTRGEEIPIEARILSVADIYEALTANRPYRKAFSREEAVAIMEYEKGHKLDPAITEIFLKMVREGKFDEV